MRVVVERLQRCGRRRHDLRHRQLQRLLRARGRQRQDLRHPESTLVRGQLGRREHYWEIKSPYFSRHTRQYSLSWHRATSMSGVSLQERMIWTKVPKQVLFLVKLWWSGEVARPVATLRAPADEVHLAHVAKQEAVRRQRNALAEE